VPIDVAKPEAVNFLAQQALAAYGRVHLVCNNAGVEGYLRGPLWEASDKDWRWTFGVNFRASSTGFARSSRFSSIRAKRAIWSTPPPRPGS
jgi:NAD(P)-dependent dehydrogenase (short-subunit alcohol dehydrogenase family)